MALVIDVASNEGGTRPSALEEIEGEWKKGGSDDALLELAAAVPLLDTPYRRTMARRQFDQELKRRGLPDTGGITTINIGTACAVEAAKKATESILNDSYLTDGEKQWCRRQIRILRGPRETFLSSSRASSQAKAAKVKKIYKMSKRKLQKHIRLQGARLVQRRWDVGVRKDQKAMTHEIIEALIPVIRMTRNTGSTQRMHEHVKRAVDQSKNIQICLDKWERTREQYIRHTRDMRVNKHEMTVPDDKKQKVPVDHQE